MTFAQAIEIVPEDECAQGIEFLRREVESMHPEPEKVSFVPIMLGGELVGRSIAGRDYQLNFMQMSHYDRLGKRLQEPRCIYPPNYDLILTKDGETLPVRFAEAVVETQDTILAAMKRINRDIEAINKKTGSHYSFPTYYTTTLVKKTGRHEILIPNLTAALEVAEEIWLHGMKCDNAGLGRDERRLMGVLSPLTNRIPPMPYYRKLF